MCRLSILSFAAFVAVLASARATEVEQCGGMDIPDLQKLVNLEPCSKIPCRLRKGTRSSISLVFTPETVIKDLTPRVSAEVLGVPLPFIGVDGISACDKVFLAEEPETQVPCPLKAGTKYIYKDSFPILSVYPRITTLIEWSLTSNNKRLICFKVPAKIV